MHPKWILFAYIVVQPKAVTSYMFLFSQEELEHLNEASAEINRLELQLDVCKLAFFFNADVIKRVSAWLAKHR